jgi:four helix bundle protein
MTNDKIQMTNEIKITNEQNHKQKFDLECRTLMFSKHCIDVCKDADLNIINKELVLQLVRSASSVGSNYREANDTITKRDFIHKIGICRREAKESKYWLELLFYTNSKLANRVKPLINEALQLAKIFAAIGINCKEKF